MSIGELIKNLVIIGCLVFGGYALYQYFWTEPITRTHDSEIEEVDEDPDTAIDLDDCERYINTERRQSCIEARTSKTE